MHCPSICSAKNEITSQAHTHEFFGFTELADECKHRHRHCFSGYTTQLIPKSCNHVHIILIETGSAKNHRHDIGIESESAVYIGKGKHIHIIKGVTTLNKDHVHEFIFTTLIERTHSSKYK